MTTQDDSYVCLVHLKDFAEFLQDEPGVLAERIFESNVRGYQSDYPVNKQIKDSLGNANVNANFWLLNNGITILGSRVTPAGSRGLSIEDPQIVNGLQTSREIFAYFAANLRKEKDTRSVLVRVIQIADSAVQDLIIKSTNSQTKMSGASLRMTDQIHRNMEELFKKVDFYYDRRKGFWRDQGKAAAKIVSVNTVAQAVVSIVLQRPDDARARPGNYFKDDNKYELVFGESALDLPAYLTCVQLLRRVEDFLANKEIDRADQKNLKFYVLALLARALTSCRQPRSQLLLDIDIAKIDDKQINLCFQQASRVYRSLAKTSDKDTVARGGEMLKRLNKPPRQKTDKKSA